MKKNRKALTLVELIVVVSLITFITGTVVATIAGGLRVWSRLQEQRDHSQWIVLAFHEMRNEIQSSIYKYLETVKDTTELNENTISTIRDILNDLAPSKSNN